MKKITSLTKEQKAKFQEYVDKWIKIGLCTEPANREKSEIAIKNLYSLTNLKEPKVIWLPCPFSAALAAVVYARIRNENIEVDSAVNSAVDSAVNSAVDSAVGSAVYSAVYRAVDRAVDSAVDSAVDRAVDSAVGSAVDRAVYRAVYSAVDRAVYSAVYSAVDSAVDRAVYRAVYSAVDRAVYRAVYSAVDSAVDSAVYSAVYRAVDRAVDSAVDSAVDRAVYSAGRSFFGGSLWCGYQAWADYFNRELSISIDRNYLDLAENCGYYWTLDSVCFASERPNLIKLDEEGRLHNEVGLSISYPSGWGLFHWHGVAVPSNWILDRKNLAAIEVLKVDNTEQRAAGAEIVGWGKIESELGAKVINDSGNQDIGMLIEMKLPDLPEAGRFLKAWCPRNGWIYEGIPNISDVDGLPIDTALAAQAWRIGDAQAEYIHPVVRT